MTHPEYSDPCLDAYLTVRDQCRIVADNLEATDQVGQQRRKNAVVDLYNMWEMALRRGVPNDKLVNLLDDQLGEEFSVAFAKVKRQAGSDFDPLPLPPAA